MAFVHTVFRESGLLELSIDIAREHECATWHTGRPFAQYRKAFVWNSLAVQLQAVSVEAPRKLRVLRKPNRVCHVLEREALMPKRGVRSPETFLTAEIRKARVDAHTGASCDEQTICFSQPGDSFFQLLIL
jgi:hypothetical protein